VESSTEADVMRRLEAVGDAHLAWAKDNFATVVRPFFLELASPPAGEGADPLTVGTFKSFQALTRLAEEGKRQGTIRDDVPPEDVAWALHMFAWAEDIALMAGGESALDEGGSLRRNLMRMLKSFGEGRD
jgi:hypothetical protein